MLRSFVQAVTLASLSFFCHAAAAEQSETKPPPASLGNLTCTLGEDVEREMAAARAQSIVCVFHASAANTEELYVGTAYFSGPAAIPGDVSLSWIVKGPAEVVAVAGGLEQSYTAQGGGSGDPENSAPLVGKQSEAIALHPLALPATEANNSKAAETRKIAVLELKLKTTVA